MAGNSTSGFSLIEMMVALALVAIVTAVAWPNASEMLAQQRLVGFSNVVAFEVNRARMEAIAKNRFVKVDIQSGGQRLCRKNSTTNSGPWVPAGACADSDLPVDLPDGTTVSGGTPVFTPTGLAVAETTMAVTNSSGNRSILVSKVGRVKFQ